MRRTWRKAKPKEEKRFRVNEQIYAPSVFLIDENGNQIGQTPTREALRMAQEAELDLVEVNPKDDMPVVKIMDYGQFKYEKEKKAHKQKVAQKKLDLKVIKLSVRISSHDLTLRVEQAIKFLQKGHKLKVDLFLKGREKQHPEKGYEIIKGFTEQLEKNEELRIFREQDLTRQGGSFTIILANKAD